MIQNAVSSTTIKENDQNLHKLFLKLSTNWNNLHQC